MKHGLFAELKRRHVYRVAVAYAVVGWLLIQLASTVFPAFGAPDWVLKAVIAVIVIGFPSTLIVAWAFELTPEGVRRTEPADSPEAREADQHRKVGRTLNGVIIGVLVVALALSLWRPWVHTKPPVIVAGTSPGHAAAPASKTPAKAASANPTAAAAKAIPAKSIAVLPFENLSSDKANGYFSDGIQDLILTKLADIGDLAVISRTSTMKYGSHPEDLKTVGEQLGVATILEGSVQRVGDQVLVNVQLIDTRNDHHIWANSYRRTLKDVFSVEGEVASKIAATLNAKLSPAETQRLGTTLSRDPAANVLYLRGEYFANRGEINYDTVAMKQAIGFYRQAIAKAPDFALARAHLSMDESNLAWFGGGGGSVAPLFADAKMQAEQALTLAPDLADAHLALGYYDYYGKGDYAKALKDFSAVLARRPNDTDALAASAYVLRRLGKIQDAIDALHKAVLLDPRSSATAFELGETYMMANRYREAGPAFQRALALDPANHNARTSYAYSMLYGTGDLTRAMSQVQGDSANLKMARIALLIDARRYTEALALLQSIPANASVFANIAPKTFRLAVLHGYLGDTAKARALYAKSLPDARAHYAALKGSLTINQGMALIPVAWAELGAGQTASGLADTARLQSIGEHSHDHMYGPQLMLYCAKLYAFADRAKLAVPVLSRTLASPGIGIRYAPVMLWIDPVWDPIRKTPAFQALQTKYVRYRPANVPARPKA